MPEMTIGYRVLRVNPADQQDTDIETALNDLVRVGYKIDQVAWIHKDEIMIFLYRDQRQA